ncbi:leucine-rich repeat-containing protein 61 isoform X5 [Chiloscyllium plagiosum]|uniref:leucine-rich repeat-containing protein 61 isoform X5 n=1 Tax=Chiloscyllium plagiosum TaxID=36176 RepID=UPI001CB82A9D|nr:leucine-rich repeat-containing protein 61 isoform X5 [Chiloscyllium plagiosum]
MEVKDREGSDENMKVTVQMLKSRTGQFDLESILFLKLRNIGITNLGCIGDCVNVERLDLSGNDISNLAPLTSLKVLIVLNLSANRISNLVCMNTAYHSAMLEIFPKIKSLDGERLSGRGSDLYQLCKKMEDSLKEMCSIGPIGKISAPKKWVEDNYWELKPIQKTQSDEAVEKFYNILKECRELNNKAADVIEKSERTLSSGK